MAMRRSEKRSYEAAARPLIRRGPVRAMVPVLVLLSIVLLALSRIDHPAVRAIRWRIAEVVTPVMSAIMVPFEPVRWFGQHVPDFLTTTAELDELRAENQRLKGWEWRARELERQLDELGTLTRLVRDPATEFVTVRVIANSSGAFVRSVMVNAGTDERLEAGYPVLSGDGLVGRVIETGRSAARVLFLTDLNSRIPVLVGKAEARALLIGDNGPAPRLDYLGAEAGVAAGEEVTTSGIGGMFPRGLRIGTVVETPRGLRVRPHAALDRVEYLSVLFYKTPRLDNDGGAGAGLPVADGAASVATPSRSSPRQP